MFIFIKTFFIIFKFSLLVENPERSKQKYVEWGVWCCRPPRQVVTAETQAAEADLRLLQQQLMNQQAELGAQRANVQVCMLASAA